MSPRMLAGAQREPGRKSPPDRTMRLIFRAHPPGRRTEGGRAPRDSALGWGRPVVLQDLRGPRWLADVAARPEFDEPRGDVDGIEVAHVQVEAVNPGFLPRSTGGGAA